MTTTTTISHRFRGKNAYNDNRTLCAVPKNHSHNISFFYFGCSNSCFTLNNPYCGILHIHTHAHLQIWHKIVHSKKMLQICINICSYYVYRVHSTHSVSCIQNYSSIYVLHKQASIVGAISFQFVTSFHLFLFCGRYRHHCTTLTHTMRPKCATHYT